MTGANACPFNALYWDFWARNASILQGNPRIPYVYSTLDKMGEDKRAAIREQAALTVQRMQDNTL